MGCRRRVHVHHRNVIIEGSGTINWLDAAAGNSEATSLSWGTATNIPLSINATIALLVADHIYRPYNLLLNPTQEGYAMALIANTATPWIGCKNASADKSLSAKASLQAQA